MLTQEALINLAVAPYKYVVGIYDPPPLNGKNVIVTGAQQNCCASAVRSPLDCVRYRALMRHTLYFQEQCAMFAQAALLALASGLRTSCWSTART